MFLLTKKFRFEASHQLMHHDGKCARLHGHSFEGALIVKGNLLTDVGPKQNMVLDYSDFPTKEIESELDHQHLNDVLGIDMPTSEYLARYIFYRAYHCFGLSMLHSVRINETCTSECLYIPNEDEIKSLLHFEHAC